MAEWEGAGRACRAAALQRRAWAKSERGVLHVVHMYVEEANTPRYDDAKKNFNKLPQRDVGPQVHARFFSPLAHGKRREGLVFLEFLIYFPLSQRRKETKLLHDQWRCGPTSRSGLPKAPRSARSSRSARPPPLSACASPWAETGASSGRGDPHGPTRWLIPPAPRFKPATLPPWSVRRE